jgi:hypothetical protein
LEFTNHNKLKPGSEKSFGIVFSIVFLIISLYFFFQSGQYYVWTMLASILFVLLAFTAPKILTVPNRLWFNFGIIIGAVVAPIVMTLVYLISIFPIGIIMRLFGKDLLNQRLNRNSNSYWIHRNESSSGSMKNQY